MKDYDYQQVGNKDLVLPPYVYKQALYAVKDFDRLKEKIRFMRSGAYAVKGVDTTRISSSGGCFDVTGFLATNIASGEMRISAIENALKAIPEKYRMGIFNHICYDEPYDDMYHKNTWKKWQQVYIYYVASGLNLF